MNRNLKGWLFIVFFSLIAVIPLIHSLYFFSTAPSTISTVGWCADVETNRFDGGFVINNDSIDVTYNRHHVECFSWINSSYHGEWVVNGWKKVNLRVITQSNGINSYELISSDLSNESHVNVQLRYYEPDLMYFYYDYYQENETGHIINLPVEPFYYEITASHFQEGSYAGRPFSISSEVTLGSWEVNFATNGTILIDESLYFTPTTEEDCIICGIPDVAKLSDTPKDAFELAVLELLISILSLASTLAGIQLFFYRKTSNNELSGVEMELENETRKLLTDNEL